MNRQINNRILFATLTAAIGILLVSACSAAMPTQAPTMSPVDVVKAYEDAYNRQDVPGAMALLTEDVSFVYPSFGFEETDRQAVQGDLEYSSGVNTEHHFIGCQASDNTLTCQITYLDDCVRSSGVNQIIGKAVLTFNDDKIQKIVIDYSSDEETQYLEYWDKFASWYQQTYPSEFTHDINTREAGIAFSKRCKEFAATLK